MARQGLYWQLRDPGVPWPNRIKLARYAWRYSSVHIPNKHQVLLDWITLTLTGKKKLPEADAEAPWRCFCDMLRSRECQTGKLPLLLKTIVGQVLIRELQRHLKARTASCARADQVVTCIEAVLTSPSLRTVFTGQLDTMIELLTVSLDLCQCDVTDRLPPSPQKVALLDTTLHLLADTPWRRVNVNQVVTSTCKWLLVSASRFMSVVAYEPPLTNLAPHALQLSTLMCQALFQKDLWEHYQQYLGIKAKSETSTAETPMPKDVEIVFKTIEQHLLVKENRKFILEFLPIFYKGFLDSYKVKETMTGIHLVVYFTQLLGIDHQDKDHIHVQDHNSIVTLASLLEVTLKREVYVRSYDTKDNFLSWLQRLGTWLLKLPDRSVEWFDCIRHLLEIDHTSLEPCLTDVFSAVWVNVKYLDKAPREAQGRLLAALLKLYGDLRRVPLMIDRCLAALRIRTEKTSLQWPEQFVDSLVTTMSTLFPMSCITIWQSLLTEIKSNYTNLAEADTKYGLTTVLRLLSMLLLDSRLADPSINQRPKEMYDLLSRTSGDVADVMVLAALKENGPDLATALSLTLACGELKLLLNRFGTLKLDNCTIKVSTIWQNMSVLHPGVSLVDGWTTVCVEASKRGNLQALHIIDELAVQHLRAVLLLESADHDWQHKTTSNIINHLMLRISEQTDDDITGSWNQQLDDLDSTNSQVATLDLICRTVTLLASFWSGEQLLSFVRRLVSAILQKDINNDGCSEHKTLHSVAVSFVNSATCHELVELQTALMTVLLERLAELWRPRTTTPKKQKAISVVQGLLASLSSSDTTWQAGRADTANILAMVGESVVAQLGVSPKNTKASRNIELEEALALLDIMQMLPLEYLHPVNKKRCMFGLLLVSGTNKAELVKTSLEQMAVITADSELRSILGELDTTNILLWLLSTVDDNTLSLRERIIFDLLKYSTKKLSRAKLLKPFLTECNHMVGQSIQGQSTCPHQMVLVAKTLGALRTAAERAHQDEALNNLCVSYFTGLATETFGLLQAGCENPRAGLLCYQHSLQHVCHTSRRRRQSRTAAKAQQAAPPKEEMPMEVDGDMKKKDGETSSDSDDDEDNNLSSAGSGMDEDDSGEFGSDVKGRLPAVCEMLDDILRNSKETIVLYNSLAVVKTICTNHNDLAKYVPDTFRNSILEHVLSVLHFSTKVISDGKSWKDLDDAARHTAVGIMTSLPTDKFAQMLHKFLRPLTAECVRKSPKRVPTALETLQDLLDVPLNEESAQLLKFASQNVLIPVQEMMAECQYAPPGAATRDVITVTLNTQTKMLSYGQLLLNSRYVCVCLHSCQCVSLDDVEDLDTFNAYHQGVYEVLNAMLVHHSQTVLKCIPAFTKAAKRLLTSVLVQSSQDRADLSPGHTQLLVTCALRVLRLVTLISTHNVDFAKIAPYMLADYIEHVQKVTVIPKVKKTLLDAVNKLMELCDAHTVRMLNTVLSPSGKQIFKVLHEDFMRYHRYQGRV